MKTFPLSSGISIWEDGWEGSCPFADLCFDSHIATTTSIWLWVVVRMNTCAAVFSYRVHEFDLAMCFCSYVPRMIRESIADLHSQVATSGSLWLGLVYSVAGKSVTLNEKPKEKYRRNVVSLP